MKKILANLSNSYVKEGILVITAIIIIFSGFFVFNTVLAAHTATVTVDKTIVKYSTPDTYTFSVTNNGPDFIAFIKITAPAEFTINDLLVCPSGWAIMEQTVSAVKCQSDSELGNELLSGSTVQVSFSAVSAPNSGDYSWAVKTSSTVTNNVNTTVDATAPTTTDNAPVGWQTIKPVVVNLTCSDGTGSGCAGTKYTTDGSDPKVSGQVGNTISLSNQGTTIIKYYSVDNVGNEEAVKEKSVQIDTVAPTTTDDASDEWTNGDVEVTLAADDDSSGVAHTYYTTDGTTPTTSSTEYTVPFPITTEGPHPLMYFSIDNVGNIEAVKTGTIVKIDKTKPTTTYSINPEIPNGNEGWYVINVPTITLTCVDQELLSGCEKIYYRWGSGSFGEYTAPIQAPEGDKTLEYYSKDNAGNQEVTKSQNVKTDTINPTITATVPTGWNNIGVSVTLIPVDYESGIFRTEVKYCEGDSCDPSTGTILNSPFIILYDTQGIFVGRYQTWDNAGNASIVGSYTVKIDLTYPTISITSPENDSYKRRVVTIITDASDVGGSEIAKVEFYYAGTTKIGEVNILPYSIDWNTVGLNGDYSLTAKAIDGAGNETVSGAITIHVDNVAPTLTSYTLDNTAFSPNGDDIKDTATVDIEFTESVRGDIYIKDNIGSEIKHLYDSGSNYVTNPNAYIWDGKNNSGVLAADGIYTIEVIGIDRAGNELIDTSKTIILDNTAPVVNIGNDIFVNAPTEVSATVTETGSGVFSYLWTGTGVSFSSDNTITTIISASADGSYTITFTVTDNVGNVGSDTMTFTRDTQFPTISVTSPVADTVYKNSVPLNFTASDPLPGTALTCSYIIDGGDSVVLPSCTNTNLTGLNDGKNTIVVTVTDAATNSTSYIPISFVFDNNNTLTVGAAGKDFTTIQEAVSKASSGDTISIANGNYTLSTTLNLTLVGLKIIGESKDGVIINAGSVNGYGIAPSANDIVLEKFTLNGPTILATGYGIHTSHINNLTIRNVTVQGSGRSEIDLNTVDGGLLEGVTVDGEDTAGVGIAITASSNVELKNINTMDNRWGGVGLYDGPGGVSTHDITFSGTNVFGEVNPVYIDAEYGAGASNIKLFGFTHSVENPSHRDILDGRGDDFIYYQQSGADAISFALTLQQGMLGVTSANQASYIQTLTTDESGYITQENNFIVGNGMSIQTAINAATSGGTVDVAAGTYDEQVVVNKALTLQGAGDTTIVKPSSAAKLIQHYGILWFGSPREVAGIVVANVTNGSSVIVKNLKIDESAVITKPGGADYFTGVFYRETGGMIDTISIIGTGPWSGGDRAYGMYLFATANTVSVEIKNSTIFNYDKNGINAQGNKLSANIHDSTITGRGPLSGDDEVQNGVLIIDGAAGTVNDNEISDNASIPANYGATGIAFYDASGSAQGNTLTDNQTGGAAQMNIPGAWTVSFSGNTINASGLSVPGISGLYAATFNAVATLNLTVNNNQLTGGSGDGISIGDIPSWEPAGNIVATIANNTISGWQKGINIVSSIALGSTATNNKITSNSAYGVFNGTEVLFNAIANWWGDASGPYHATNPAGLGDDVSDNVSFRPWYTNADLADLDEIAPTPTIFSTAGTLTNISPIPITVTFSESVVSFEAGDITVGNGAVGSFTGSGSSYAFSITPVGQGAVTVNIAANVAWDTSGNYNAAATFSITFDTIAPTATFVSETLPPALTNSMTTDITVAGTDVTYYKYKLDSASYSSETPVATHITLSGLADGPHTLSVIGRDVAGNWQAEGTATIHSWTIDKTAPTVTLTNTPANLTNQTATNITIGGTEVTYYKYKLDSGSYSSETAVTTLVTLTGLSEGAHTLSVIGRDVAGNWQITATIHTWTVDTQVPTISASTPSDNAVGVDPTGNITVTFSEPVTITSSDVELKKSGATDAVTVAVTFDSINNKATIDPSVILDNNSTYVMIVKTSVTDLAGNGLVQEKTWSFTTSGSYNLQLTQGWNLISMPVIPNNTAIASVLGLAASSIEAVWAYDAVNDAWYVYRPASPSTSNLASMTAGYGYWVNYTSGSPATLAGPGNLFLEGNYLPPQRTLKAGWNLIGYYQKQNTESVQVDYALKSLKNPDTDRPWWTMIMGYNNSSKQFTPLENTGFMDPGKGYWILMAGRATDTYIYAPGQTL